MKKVIVIAMMAFAPALMMSTAYAQKPTVVTSDKAGWHKIGETTVDFKREKDQILVMGRDSYKALKLKVTEAPIHIASMTVVYGKGKYKEAIADTELPGEIMAAGESKVIHLKNGANRNIQKVVYTYHTMGHKKAVETNLDLKKNDVADNTGASIEVHKKAHVELWGLK
jgi:hypothetical protein